MEGIKLNDQYTIVASPLTWVLMQYKGAPSFSTKGIAFQPELADILTSAVSREIRVPATVKELSEKVDKLNARIEELLGSLSGTRLRTIADTGPRCFRRENGGNEKSYILPRNTGECASHVAC